MIFRWFLMNITHPCNVPRQNSTTIITDVIIQWIDIILYTKLVDSVFCTLWLATQTWHCICYLPPIIVLDLMRVSLFVYQKKELLVFGAGYPLVWYILKQLIHRHSGGYLPHHFGAWQISTTIHLHSSEWLLITRLATTTERREGGGGEYFRGNISRIQALFTPNKKKVHRVPGLHP